MIGSLVVCSVAFAAGIVVGIYLNEKDIVKMEDLRKGGESLVHGVKWVVATVRSETTPVPPQPIPKQA